MRLQIEFFSAIRYRIRKRKKPLVHTCEMIRMNNAVYNLTWWIHLLREPGKSDVHWLSRDVPREPQFLDEILEKETESTINYWGIYFYITGRFCQQHQLVVYQSRFWQKLRIPVLFSRSDVRRLRTCYSQGYHLRKSKSPFSQFSNSSLNFPMTLWK